MEWKKGFYRCDEVDTLHTVRDMLQYAKKKFAANIAYQQIENQAYESAITFRGFANNVDALGTALYARNMQGKHIALLGRTSIEWITSYFSVIDGVGVVVPIDCDLNLETMAKQLNFGDVDVLICSRCMMKKAAQVLRLCPRIKTVVALRTASAPELEAMCDVLYFESLLKEGQTLLKEGDTRYTQAQIDPEALAELVFTSGTTGANKGVMLCHRNICSAIQGAKRLVNYLPTSMSVLPANHTYELTCHLVASIEEGTTVYINDDLRHVLQNLGHFAPDMLCMVPMMINLMVRKIRIEAEKNGLSSHLEYGIKFSNFIRKFGIDERKAYFEPITKNFGGKLKKIICGGAPLSQEVIDFMDSIGITVLNGYGITECAPLVAVNGDKLQRKGSVGHVLPTCQIRIDNPDENGNGEIQVKGGNVMLGYYKMPADTAAVFTEDGWFRTGDLGRVDRDGFLFISGRVKNLIILSNGKNIYPEELEDYLAQHIPYLKESVVYTDSDCTGIYAICYLDSEFCKAHNLNTSDEKRAYLMEDIRKYNQKMPSFKRIADVQISETEFEKTSTKKIRRFKVLEGRAIHV